MDNVESVDFAGAEGTRREDLFDLEKGLAGISPKKFGKTIADIIITDTYDHEIYISVKNKLGDVIYNGGSGGILKLIDNQIKYLHPGSLPDIILNKTISRLD